MAEKGKELQETITEVGGSGIITVGGLGNITVSLFNFY